MAKLTVFDGASTIGGNKIYLEEGGEAVFLDFGMNFARYGEFFQEFLSERDTRGIHDLIHLGMIPRISPYRKDLIPSDLDTSSFRRLAPRAVLLSHAHLDHCGNISLLDRSIPVVASGVTAAILKGMRDTGASGMGSEVAYISTRVPHDDYGGRVLASGRNLPYRGRDFY
ncbi:MAG TPA: MBL fold metallo-hydrolase, partial [Candidatus Methanomethylicus sp.]|nr:MBL fold metallo-hydrolase [Candidatus Methanomethylicus sp.]